MPEAPDKNINNYNSHSEENQVFFFAFTIVFVALSLITVKKNSDYDFKKKFYFLKNAEKKILANNYEIQEKKKEYFLIRKIVLIFTVIIIITLTLLYLFLKRKKIFSAFKKEPKNEYKNYCASFYDGEKIFGNPLSNINLEEIFIQQKRNKDFLMIYEIFRESLTFEGVTLEENKYRDLDVLESRNFQNFLEFKKNGIDNLYNKIIGESVSSLKELKKLEKTICNIRNNFNKKTTFYYNNSFFEIFSKIKEFERKVGSLKSEKQLIEKALEKNQGDLQKLEEKKNLITNEIYKKETEKNELEKEIQTKNNLISELNKLVDNDRPNRINHLKNRLDMLKANFNKNNKNKNINFIFEDEEKQKMINYLKGLETKNKFFSNVLKEAESGKFRFDEVNILISSFETEQIELEKKESTFQEISKKLNEIGEPEAGNKIGDLTNQINDLKTNKESIDIDANEKQKELCYKIEELSEKSKEKEIELSATQELENNRKKIEQAKEIKEDEILKFQENKEKYLMEFFEKKILAPAEKLKKIKNVLFLNEILERRNKTTSFDFSRKKEEENDKKINDIVSKKEEIQKNIDKLCESAILIKITIEFLNSKKTKEKEEVEKLTKKINDFCFNNYSSFLRKENYLKNGRILKPSFYNFIKYISTNEDYISDNFFKRIILLFEEYKFNCYNSKGKGNYFFEIIQNFDFFLSAAFKKKNKKEIRELKKMNDSFCEWSIEKKFFNSKEEFKKFSANTQKNDEHKKMKLNFINEKILQNEEDEKNAIAQIKYDLSSEYNSLEVLIENYLKLQSFLYKRKIFMDFFNDIYGEFNVANDEIETVKRNILKNYHEIFKIKKIIFFILCRDNDFSDFCYFNTVKENKGNDMQELKEYRKEISDKYLKEVMRITDSVEEAEKDREQNNNNLNLFYQGIFDEEKNMDNSILGKNFKYKNLFVIGNNGELLLN